jgi:hypothetical protein
MCRVICGIAGRVNRTVTRPVTCPAPDRITGETTDEGLRQVTAETALRTMYEATMYETPRIVLQTMDEATAQTTS